MIQLLVIFLYLSSAVLGSGVNITSSSLLPLTNTTEDVNFLNAIAATASTATTLLADNYAKKYEVKFANEGGEDEMYTQLQSAVPITSCHDSTGGSGGSISFSIIITLTPDIIVDPGLSMPIINLFTVSGSFEVSKAFGITASYDCTISKGSRGQIWAAPFAVVGSVQHRVAYVDKQKSDEVISRTEWTRAYDAKLPSKVSPIFSCRTDKYVACTIPVPSIQIPLSNDLPEVF